MHPWLPPPAISTATNVTVSISASAMDDLARRSGRRAAVAPWLTRSLAVEENCPIVTFEIHRAASTLKSEAGRTCAARLLLVQNGNLAYAGSATARIDAGADRTQWLR